MEFKTWASPEYHYTATMSPDECYSYSVPCEEWMDSPACVRDIDIRNGQIPAMQRYLEEPMPHVFADYASDSDGLCVQPWFGYPVRPVEYARLPHVAPYGPVQGVPSPGSHSISGSSSYVSSNPGEPREVSSWASPELAMVDCAATSYYPDHATYEYCESIHIKHDRAHTKDFSSCVALHDVQHHADEQPDEPNGLEDDGTAYPGYLGYMDAEDGYQPLDSGSSNRHSFEHALAQQHTAPAMTLDSGTSSPSASPQTPSSPVVKHPSISPNIRRRRAPSGFAAAPQNNNHRVTKRRGTTSANNNNNNKHIDEPAPNRAFPCSLAIYGCPATFGSKNEWKRHINTQHMRLDFWRCDQCPATRPAATTSAATGDVPTVPRKYNDFNRKDLFIQHIRRMHQIGESPAASPSASTAATATAGTKKPGGRNITAAAAAQAQTRAQDEELMAIAGRCRVRTRSPPSGSGCLFCGVRFHGADSWDERLEHIGRHFECLRKSEGAAGSSGDSGKADPRYWRADPLVENWMLEEGILMRPHGKGQRPVLA